MVPRVVDHVGFAVADYERSKMFYERALAPLGVALLMEFAGEAAGFGRSGRPSFFVETQGKPVRGRLHIALRAESRAQVDAFHAAAIEAGGTTMALRGSVPSTTPTITAPTCSTPTATTSKPFATSPSRNLASAARSRKWSRRGAEERRRLRMPLGQRIAHMRPEGRLSISDLLGKAPSSLGCSGGSPGSL
jgi:Glyoxalase/Bleomycin resistance protein/Dioxygenase superfamily